MGPGKQEDWARGTEAGGLVQGMYGTHAGGSRMTGEKGAGELGLGEKADTDWSKGEQED
jgi:hypothetical protein